MSCPVQQEDSGDVMPGLRDMDSSVVHLLHGLPMSVTPGLTDINLLCSKCMAGESVSLRAGVSWALHCKPMVTQAR